MISFSYNYFSRYFSWKFWSSSRDGHRLRCDGRNNSDAIIDFFFFSAAEIIFCYLCDFSFIITEVKIFYFLSLKNARFDKMHDWIWIQMKSSNIFANPHSWIDFCLKVVFFFIYPCISNRRFFFFFSKSNINVPGIKQRTNHMKLSDKWTMRRMLVRTIWETMTHVQNGWQWFSRVSQKYATRYFSK